MKHLLDRMAEEKLNVFHWHLTDDQGWRLEIKKYPNLTVRGAQRKLVKNWSPQPVWYDAKTEGTYGPYFYTRADVAEIVAYAKERGIEVVPEIEMPGHSLAALASYPELCCFPEEVKGNETFLHPSFRKPGKNMRTYCIGSDETLRFLEGVLDEVCEMFPGKVVHIGGDEAPHGNWEVCPKCQARMKAEGLKTPAELQGWMMNHFVRYLAKKGKTAMGWEEILAGKPDPKDVIAQCWHGPSGTKKAVEAGYRVVLSPPEYCYFDFSQGCYGDKNRYNGPGASYAKVKSFNPMAGIPEANRAQVLGAECCNWSELTVTPEELEAKIWPRATALAGVLSPRPKLELPPCGLLVGNAIYNAGFGFPGFTGPVLTHWKSYTKSPLELTELTVKENQGNLIQYWWAGSWNRYYDYPQSRAHYLGFEDLGIRIPPPDWENLKNISLDEFPAFAEHKDRAGYGMDKCFRRCEELGLWSTMIYLPSDANEKYTKRFRDYSHYLGYDFGERFGFHCDPSLAKKKGARLDAVAKEFTSKVAAHISENVEKGYGRISATSGNFHMDYEVAAGLDFTLFEDCTAELNVMSGFSRGLMRQYGLEIWGSHVADEHYQWLPWSNPHRGETCRAAMLMKYMAGAKVIVQESGAWDNQTTMAGAPTKLTPRMPYPIGTKLTPEMIAPYGKEAVKTMHLIDDTSDFCRRYRKVMSDFYDFVKANPEPAGQPETTIALVKGNYDLSSFGGEYDPNHAVAGLSAVAEENPNWRHGEPERGWQTAMDVFFPRPRGIFGTDDKNLRFTGTPWGQVDVISFAYDQPSADFLLKNYKLLVFVGWNTSSVKQFRTLREYVQKGGKLFISLPQMSTDVTRNYRAYTTEDLVEKGDFSSLCGVKVKGRGKSFYWATGTDWKPNRWGLSYERRFGVFYGPAGDLEITAKESETLVLDHEALQPVLLRNKVGKGEVYFMNTWYYPGYYTQDNGCGAKEDENLVSFIWRRLAKENRGTVYMTEVGSDEPGRECAFVNLSHFPSNGRTMLFNLDFEKPHTIDLHRPGKVEKVTLAPSEFKTIDN